MAFEAPIDKVPEAFDTPAAGDYHLQLSFCDDDGGDKGEMICDFEVLAGSTPGQEGKTQREYFTKTAKAMQRVHALAVALGMVTTDQLKAMKAAGHMPTYDFEAKVGTQLCASLTDDVYEGKHRIKMGFGMYAVADAKVATWPKNTVMLAKAGIVLPTVAAPAKDNPLAGL